MKQSVYIATPTNGGTVTTEYLSSLAGTLADFSQRGIGFQFGNIDAAHIAAQRDALARMFLDGPCTHLLFIDSDMKFPRGLASEYLAMGKPVVGAIYPHRTVDVARLASAVKETADLRTALAKAIKFNVKVSGTVTGHKNFCLVEGLGMGFCLIARECFASLKPHVTNSINAFVGKDTPEYFGEIRQPDSRWLGEDYSFCKRWRGAGGEIWADASGRVSHIGRFAYSSSYLDHLKATATSAPGRRGRSLTSKPTRLQ
jgi:hypothetical protein